MILSTTDLIPPNSKADKHFDKQLVAMGHFQLEVLGNFLRLLCTEISDFAYQLSTVINCNKLVLLFFVGYGTTTSFVTVSAQLFIGCVSSETLSSLDFSHLDLAQSVGTNFLLIKCCVF